MKTQPLPNWEKQFNAFIDNRRCMPFIWGRNDCCLFACDGIRVKTGMDLALPFRGYSTAFGAARSLLRYSCRDVFELAELFAEQGAITQIAASLADRCDLLMYHSRTGISAGLCVGEYGAFVDNAGGLIFVPRSKCEATAFAA
jgi:hypothetical protein